MHLAARAGALDVLEVLLEDLDKADKLEYVNAADKSGITPVFLAKQKGMLGVNSLSFTVLLTKAVLRTRVTSHLSSLPSRRVCSEQTS